MKHGIGGILKNTGKGLIGIVASTITTALITGQPLTGLVELKGLSQTFINSSVPAWAFAFVLLIALFGIYYALTHLPKRRPIGQVHFIPDAYNCGWSKQTDTDMNVRLGGTFTYDESSELIILQAYLKGTRPTTNLLAQTEAPDGTMQMISTSELWLQPGISHKAFINMRLRPVLGTAGNPLRRKLVLRDKFNRELFVGPIDFPYSGPKP